MSRKIRIVGDTALEVEVFIPRGARHGVRNPRAGATARPRGYD